jgi:hypothetical protein
VSLCCSKESQVTSHSVFSLFQEWNITCFQVILSSSAVSAVKHQSLQFSHMGHHVSAGITMFGVDWAPATSWRIPGALICLVNFTTALITWFILTEIVNTKNKIIIFPEWVWANLSSAFDYVKDSGYVWPTPFLYIYILLRVCPFVYRVSIYISIITHWSLDEKKKQHPLVCKGRDLRDLGFLPSSYDLGLSFDWIH